MEIEETSSPEPTVRLADLDALVDRARALLARGTGTERCVIGVVGAPGSGKSTLVETLIPALEARLSPTSAHGWVAHLPMDGFHLADAQLDRLGRRGRKGAADTFDVDGYVTLLERARTELEHPVYAPGFERRLEQPIAAALVVAPGARIILTEGNYLLHDADGWARVRPLLDECWYVDLADETRRERLVRRHVQHGKSSEAAAAWVDQVDEPNTRLVERGRAYADWVIRA